MVINKRIIYFLCFAMLCSQTGVDAASAVTVPAEEGNIAADAQIEARRLVEEKLATAELAAAKAEATQAEVLAAEAKAAEIKASVNLLAAEAWAAEASNKAAKARAAAEAASTQLAKAEAALSAANAASDNAKAIAARAQSDAEAAEAEADQIAENEAGALEVTVIDEARIDAIAAKADEAAARIDAAAVSADAKAALADRLAAEADVKADAVDLLKDAKDSAADASIEAANLLADAVEAHMDAKSVVEDARTTLEDAKITSSDALSIEQSAKQYVAELMKPRPANGNLLYFDTGFNYYSWHNNKGQSGYQIVQPYSFYYADNKNRLEYGLNNAYVLSQNSSPNNQGRIAAWSDTDFSIAHTSNNNKYPIRYSLLFSLPTGKTSLSKDQVNAVMDEDLVERNVFGEGFNITPGISISHKIGKEDTWTLGMRYGFRGSYNLSVYDADSGNVSIANADSGDFWAKTLTWQHAGDKWQMVGELNHSSFSGGRLGDKVYYQGDELDANLVYNRELTADKSLMLYYRYLNQQPYQGLDETGTLTGQYVGFVWSKDYGKKHLFRFTGDYMKRSGSTFDPHTAMYIDGRTKYTIGVGYDWSLKSNSKLSLDVQKFRMNNQAASENVGTNYDGYNVYIKYGGNL